MAVFLILKVLLSSIFLIFFCWGGSYFTKQLFSYNVLGLLLGIFRWHPISVRWTFFFLASTVVH